MQTQILAADQKPRLSLNTACLYFIVGILSVEALPELLPIWVVAIGLASASLVYIYLSYKRKRRFYVYMTNFICLFMLGCAATHFEIYRQPHQMLSKAGPYNFEGVVESSQWRNDGRVRAIVTPMAPDINAVEDKAHTADLSVYGRIRLTMRLDRLPVPGEKLLVSARLFPLSGPFLPGMPDYGRTAFLQKIGASGFAYKVQFHSAQKENASIFRKIQSARQALDSYFQNRLNPIAASIASSLYLGKRDRLPQDIYSIFQKSGLAHLLAISGLHTALFCLSLFSILRLCLLSVEHIIPISAHKAAAFFAVLAGFAYLLIADMPVSAMRAWGIAAIVLCAIIIHRRAMTLRTLSLIAILMLLWKPSYLYQPAFQLSFSATFGIVVTHQLLRKYLPRSGVLAFFLSLSVTSLAAGIITTPFIAYHFAIFTPYSLLSNLLAVPLMGLLMPFGLVVSALDATGLSVGLWKIYEFGVFFLIEIAKFFSALPAAGIWIKPPDVYLLGLWMLSITLMLTKLFYRTAFGIFGICLFFGLWILSPIPDMIQIQARHEHILIVNGDHHIITTDEISEFWQSIMARQLGNKPLHICQEPICHIGWQNQMMHVVRDRSGITEACRAGRQAMISLHRPKFICAAEGLSVIENSETSALYYIDVHELSLGLRPNRLDR